jgi:hypothetical protein
MKRIAVLAFGVFAFLTISTQFSLADSDNVVDLLKKVTKLNQHDSSTNMKAVSGEKATQYSGDLFADTVPKESQTADINSDSKSLGRTNGTNEGL